VDDDFRVVALVTDSDIQKDIRFPLATKDDNKQLKTFIAVESRLEAARERIGRGNDAGIDGIVVDASIVFKEQLEIAKYCKRNFPDLDVVLGNVDSAEMVRSIISEASEYCDALRVGIGPGYACKTQQELGTGRAQASAIRDCVQEAKRLEGEYGFMPMIADGGLQPERGRVFSDIKRARSMLIKALPDMFHYLNNPDISFTTNGLESYFSRLKSHYRQHRGLRKKKLDNYFKWYLYYKPI
jgi:hypothetical protein